MSDLRAEVLEQIKTLAASKDQENVAIATLAGALLYVGDSLRLLAPQQPPSSRPPRSPIGRARRVPAVARHVRETFNVCESCKDAGVPALGILPRAPGEKRRRTRCRHCLLIMCSECFQKTPCRTNGGGYHQL